MRKAFVLGLGMLVFAAAAIAFANRTPSKHTLDVAQYPVRGIAVSQAQGTVDWEKLSGQGIGFVYIGVSEGEELVDSRLRENWQNAGRANLARGAYHRYSLCGGGAAQAKNFLAAVPREGAALPPAVAIAFDENCRPTQTDFLREFTLFVDQIETGTGQRTILHMNREIYRRYLRNALLEHPLWLRSPGREPDYANRPWSIWQAGEIRLEGIEGAVAIHLLDRRIGSLTEFARASGR